MRPRITPAGLSFKLGVFALALEALSAVALMATSSYLISRASEQPPIMYLMMAVVGVRAFALGKATFRYLHRLGLHDATLTHSARLRPLVFRNYLDNLGDSKSSLDALETATTDVDRLQNWPLRILPAIIQSFSAAALAGVLITLWFPTSGLVTFLAGVATATLIFAFVFRISNSQSSRDEQARLLRIDLGNLLANFELVQHYGLLQSRIEEVSERASQIKRLDIRTGSWLGLGAALTSAFSILAASASGVIAASTSLETTLVLIALALLTPLAVFDLVASIVPAAISLKPFLRARQRLSLKPHLSNESQVSLTNVQVISLENVTVERHGAQILRNLNFSFNSGNSYSIVGRSGSGKTSLAYAMCGLIESPKGLLFDQKEASEFSPESVRKEIVLVQQQPHIFAGTVRDNLMLAATNEALMIEALEKVDLWDEFLSRGGLDLEVSEGSNNISGGQAQRLAIARALITNPSFLILDEPTSGLDWENAMNLASTLKRLTSQGSGVIIITHDLELARLFDFQLSLD